MTRHHNDGLRKICGCPRRTWAKCRHPWHFSFKWQGTHYRFSLDRQLGRHVAGRTQADAESERLRTEIRAGRFRQPAAPAQEPSGITLETFADRFLERFQPRKARTGHGGSPRPGSDSRSSTPTCSTMGNDSGPSPWAPSPRTTSRRSCRR